MMQTMRKFPVILALGALVTASPATANHIFSPRELWQVRISNARLSNEDAERQFPLQPDLFSSMGEARSFMTRAFSSEYDPDDDSWYRSDHRGEVIASDWFQRRQDP
jgi:hypothetical protein